MTYRQIQLETGYYYHVYSKSIDQIPIFLHHANNQRFLQLIKFYSINKPLTRFSYYQRMIQTLDNKSLKKLLSKTNYIVKIIAYCLMPNHFHFLIYQLQPNGIHHFMRRLLNAYARYFNLKNKRRGSLFESNFQVALIESDEYLIHLTRYIHLNPVTAYLVEEPELYRYSSYALYLQDKHPNPPFDTKTILT